MLLIGSSARTREGRNLLLQLALHAIDHLTGARFLSKEEDIVGPYKFGVYDILVLPPSFPYGGMVSRLSSLLNPEAWRPSLTGLRRKTLVSLS
jgi:hypothetical protein